tara:strand:- start:308 stop:1171 length:864 start_codon:yes stop_codon:yes gene_type:complete
MDDKNIDLDLSNYELNDILNLFEITGRLDKIELQKAKKSVLQMHPDKSKLDKKYYIFFSEAYKILLQVYRFRIKAEQEDKDYEVYEEDKGEKLLIQKFLKNENFNKIFNEAFENNKCNDNLKNGYGEWLKSEEDIDYSKTTLNNMAKTFEDKKNYLRTIIKKPELRGIYTSNNVSNLDDGEIEEYSSDLFSKLKFDDLKKVHKESLIPISNEDFNNKIKFQNINALQDFRNKQDVIPFGEKESNNYFNNEKEIDNNYSMKRAFKLAKEDEEIRKINNNWWKGIRQLL